MPDRRCSLINLAWSWVRNSWQLGGAVRLIKSYKDLQSVVINELFDGGSWWSNFWTWSGGVAVDWSPSRGGIAANAGGSWRRVSSACFQSRSTLFSQPQYNLTHERISTAPARDMASADKVLTATFWIFLECQTIGFTMLVLFSPINLWHDMIIIPWWESGTFGEAKEASEKAMNRSWSRGIGWIFNVVTANILASCNTLFASMSVLTLARLIWDCNIPSLLHKSGRLLVAAYCKDPITARRDCLSGSVTAASGTALRSLEMEIAWMSLMYCSWFTQILSSSFWSIFRPVKVKFRGFLLPKGNFCSRLFNLAWNNADPQHKPASTWIPMRPSVAPGLGVG